MFFTKRMASSKDPYYTTVDDLSTYRDNGSTVYINSLSDYTDCNLVNVAQQDGDFAPVPTINTDEELPGLVDHMDYFEKPRCAVYCAHEGCDSAKNFMKEHRKTLEKHCSNVLYLKHGAKGMLEQPTVFALKESLRCREKLNAPRK